MRNKSYLIIAAVIALAVISSILVRNAGEVHISVAGGTLYGSLCDTGGHDSVVLLIAGSGPTDRNGNSKLLEGRDDSFKELSAALKKQGIASLRYDKRTSGKSQEAFDLNNIRFVDFVDDCSAWVDYLKDMGYRRIYLAGHSQGSLVAILTAEKKEVAGVISIAGAGQTIDMTLEKQLKSQAHFDEAEAIIENMRRGIITEKVGKDLENIFGQQQQRFLIEWMAYNPAYEIQKLKVPILLIQGDQDSQMDMEEFEFLKGGVPKAEAVAIHNMNHVLKVVETVKDNENSYTDPSYPLNTDMVDSIVDFIR